MFLGLCAIFAGCLFGWSDISANRGRLGKMLTKGVSCGETFHDVGASRGLAGLKPTLLPFYLLNSLSFVL